MFRVISTWRLFCSPEKIGNAEVATAFASAAVAAEAVEDADEDNDKEEDGCSILLLSTGDEE